MIYTYVLYMQCFSLRHMINRCEFGIHTNKYKMECYIFKHKYMSFNVIL